MYGIINTGDGRDLGQSNFDSFGRLRVSGATNLANIVQVDSKLEHLIDEEIGGDGYIQYNDGYSSTTLSTQTSGDYAIRQTLERYEYQSGRSTLLLLTMSDFQPQTNITKRVGYFSNTTYGGDHSGDLDGIFLESSNDTFYFRTFKEGTETDSVAQSEWNIDALDGYGPSRITLDKTKILLFWIDYQWLGAGLVRFGFVIDGQFILCHKDGNYNQSKNKVYMRSPIQPLRWEIRQTGVGSGSFDQVCASVTQEGEALQPRRTIGVYSNSYISGFNSGTDYAIGGFRLRSDRINGKPRYVDISFLTDSNEGFKWEIRINATVAGTYTFAPYSDSSLEAWIATDNTNTVTGGKCLAAGLFSQRSDKQISVENFGVFPFNVRIDGTREELVLVVRPISGTNLRVNASAILSELT